MHIDVHNHYLSSRVRWECTSQKHRALFIISPKMNFKRSIEACIKHKINMFLWKCNPPYTHTHTFVSYTLFQLQCRKFIKHFLPMNLLSDFLLTHFHHHQHESSNNKNETEVWEILCSKLNNVSSSMWWYKIFYLHIWVAASAKEISSIEREEEWMWWINREEEKARDVKTHIKQPNNYHQPI
jgi:hypothetical protein